MNEQRPLLADRLSGGSRSLLHIAPDSNPFLTLLIYNDKVKKDIVLNLELVPFVRNVERKVR